MDTPNLDNLKQWIGNTEETNDNVTLSPAVRMAATLDWEGEQFQLGDRLPLGWHWLYFLPTVPTAQTSQDGHPKRGGFLPPVPFPRRMWAGGRLEFLQPLRIGQAVQKKSEVTNVTIKQGRTGGLIFVTVRHEISGPKGLALIEEQDLVYREAPTDGNQKKPTPRPAPPQAEAQWSREIVPSVVLLFRYSALTFNAHRIHYDRDYCALEGYPDLVVHGPLTATLLLALLEKNIPSEAIKKFSFRGVSPLFDTYPFTIQGRQDNQEVRLWAANHEQHLAMEARATLV